MSTEWRFLLFSSVFSIAVAIVYWIVAGERAGTTLLAFMGTAAGFMAIYLLTRGRRLERPEDEPEADHAEHAGATVGHFSAGSLWPFVMGIGSALAALGFVYGAWLLGFGLALFAWSVVGLMMESRG